MPIRQMNDGPGLSSGQKSRNGKGTSVRHNNSMGSNKHGSTQGSIGMSESRKKTAMGNIGNVGNSLGGRVGNNIKHQSMAFNGQLSDFDHPLMSNTVDLTVKQVTQKDNQSMYKMIYQGSASG